MSGALESNELLKLKCVWVCLGMFVIRVREWVLGLIYKQIRKNRLSIAIVTGNGLDKFNSTSLRIFD